MNNNFDLFQIINEEILNKPVEILDYRILIGANYFSSDKVILMRIKLNEYDEVFTNNIPNFNKKLIELIPTLEEHYCSLKEKGGFLIRLEEGTLLGHVVEHIAIELQNLAKMNVGFGKTRETKEKGVYNIVFRFADEYAGIYAGKNAVNIVNSILTNTNIDINHIINNLVLIRENRMLGYSTQKIVDEVIRRKIPFYRLDKHNFVQIGTGCYRKLIRATLTQNTSFLSIEKTDDKYYTYQILDELNIPTPKTKLVKNINEALEFFYEINKPIVIKPCKGYRGKKVSINLKDELSIIKAFIWAYTYDKDVIVQEFVEGNLYRLLIIDGNMVAAAKLIPPFIVGDGKSTIEELISELNNDPLREYGDKGKLSKIEIDEDTLKIIEINGYTLSTILEEGKKLFIKNTGNMRCGATAIDVTDEVNEYNKFIAERVVKVFNLDVAGVDIIAPDIKTPINENNGKIIEINSVPDLRIHLNPTIGKQKPVHILFVDYLFKNQKKYEIPIISITGSEGATLLSEMLNLALSAYNYKTGLINNNGIFINNYLISTKNCYDSRNVEILLKDPYINIAIIETPVKSILNWGLGYLKGYIGIFLNLQNFEEYYKYDHIKTIDDIAYAMSVVVEELSDNGYALLNVDYDLIYDCKSRIKSKIAYFSTNYDNYILNDHIKKGEICCTKDGYRIILYDNERRYVLCYLDEINENLYDQKYKLECLLAFCTTLYVLKFSELDIRDILRDISNKLKS